MQIARFAAIAGITAALGALAGCGSSSSSSSSKPASSAAPVTSTQAAQSTASTTPAVLITTKQAKLGTILAYGPKRMTVYLFEADRGMQSNCAGACAHAWPPVIGKPQAGGTAQASDLGTITRPGGTTQVTYKGHPLYLFIKDKDAGDAYGQGVKAFGADWYVLAPSGNKIDKS
ncbi:MAG: COG4315 family predicted lipoprotein [Solirubrobacteraceae bacterium]